MDSQQPAETLSEIAGSVLNGTKPSVDSSLSSPTTANAAAEAADRQLNVSDALSYLDTVKTQFADQPDVYNQFLDIMKDFKSQSIDTPGVISRVSILFQGNGPLVAGFNTFLPPGYRIDVCADRPNSITVTSPSGTVIHPAGAILHFPVPSALPTPPYPPPPISHQPTPTPVPLPPSEPVQPPIPTPTPQPEAPPHPTQEPMLPHGAYNMIIDQFDMPQAIDFLSRVRERFLGQGRDPEVYKKFVELIQAIPKGEHHQSLTQIQAHGQRMLRGDPDLMTEFLQFLGQAVPQHELTPHEFIDQPWIKPDDKGTPKKTPVPLKRKKRATDTSSNQGARVSPSKKAKHVHPLDSPVSYSPHPQPPSPPVSHLPPTQQLTTQALAAFHHQPYGPALYAPATPPDPKLRFFDHARRRLTDPVAYDDFLKLLTLFSQDIIDIETLVQRAAIFLDDDDLLDEFKDVLGWDEGHSGVYNIPPGSIRIGPPVALNAAYLEDGQGPSYRHLPESEIHLACSGRDELCRSVLNDEWVSHPTWASEEAGFVTHKKNAFEDALHKSEEERHEYHIQLQALSATIAVLEPLFQRFETMQQEDLMLVKLEPDFGGPSKALYHRMIKKIYGRDTGLEIIVAMQESPAVAVPVVLSRLKQKDEEWRRALREWSRTWREVDSKNFYKSLDHQGITFKINDKKGITSKYFVQQIHALRKEQIKTSLDGPERPQFARGNLGYQLSYCFEDLEVLRDSLRMVYTYLDHSHAQYSPQERRSVEGFLRIFIPLFFDQPAAEFNAACGLEPEEGNEKEDEDDEDLHAILMRIAQKRARSKHKGYQSTASGVPSRVPTPDVNEGEKDEGGSSQEETHHGRAVDVWVNTNGSKDLKHPLSPVERPFFANTTFYTLVRLVQMLYSRLLECKEIGEKLEEEKHYRLMANPIAQDLGLDDPNGGPAALLTQSLEAIRKSHQESASTEKLNVVYIYLLDACEKQFDGELDAATFEEHMRWFLGKSAYKLFTLDKLMAALIKQVQSVLADNRSLDIWSLLQSAYQSQSVGIEDIVRYRREAECHVGTDDHLYRMQWSRQPKALGVQLMADQDPSVEGEADRIRRWREYTCTYAMEHPSEWTPSRSNKEGSSAVFLKRSCCKSKDGEQGWALDTMCVRFRLPDYKVMYERGSEDMFVRVAGKEERERAVARELVRRQCKLLE